MKPTLYPHEILCNWLADYNFIIIFGIATIIAVWVVAIIASAILCPVQPLDMTRIQNVPVTYEWSCSSPVTILSLIISIAIAFYILRKDLDRYG